MGRSILAIRNSGMAFKPKKKEARKDLHRGYRVRPHKIGVGVDAKLGQEKAKTPGSR